MQKIPPGAFLCHPTSEEMCCQFNFISQWRFCQPHKKNFQPKFQFRCPIRQFFSNFYFFQKNSKKLKKIVDINENIYYNTIRRFMIENYPAALTAFMGGGTNRDGRNQIKR